MIVVLTDLLGPKPKAEQAGAARPLGGVAGQYLNDLAERYRHLGARAVVFADTLGPGARGPGRSVPGWRSSDPQLLLRGGRLGAESVLLADVRLWPDRAVRNALERNRFSLAGLTVIVERMATDDYLEVVEPSEWGYSVKRCYLATSPHRQDYFPVALMVRPKLLGVGWQDLLDAVGSGDGKGVAAFAAAARSQVVVPSPWLESPEQFSRWVQPADGCAPGAHPGAAGRATGAPTDAEAACCIGTEPPEFFSVVVPSRRHMRRRVGIYRVGKRVMDICGAAVGLALTVPMYPLIALAIKLDSPGPVFFVHRRQTLGGREFGCLKFRTMVDRAEHLQGELRNEVDGPQFHVRNDPRVTRVGRLLRRTNLDEVPQFWNVLLGHMSLVGPRPSPDSENQYCPAWREARLSVRPGMTGAWQVYRSHDRSKGDFDEWIQYDLHYVRTCSLRTDLTLLWRTAKMMARQIPVMLKNWCGLCKRQREPHAAVAGHSAASNDQDRNAA